MADEEPKKVADPGPETERQLEDNDVVELEVPDDEDLLWTSGRAKLYRFTKDAGTGAGEWKDRGVGQVYILRYKDNQKVHAVMRREKTHKVCMNHMVVEGIEMKANSGSEKIKERSKMKMMFC